MIKDWFTDYFNQFRSTSLV